MCILLRSILIAFTVFLVNAASHSTGDFIGSGVVFADPLNPLDDHLPAGDVTDSQADKTYESIKAALVESYTKSPLPVAGLYNDWRRYNTTPYVSEPHGGRLVNDFANSVAADYGRFEIETQLPPGSVIAMDSFRVIPSCLPLSITADAVQHGPLFVMEKMKSGFNTASGDWRFSMVMPDGGLFGETKGVGHDRVEFCANCHQSAKPGQDWLFFPPKDYRISGESEDQVAQK